MWNTTCLFFFLQFWLTGESLVFNSFMVVYTFRDIDTSHVVHHVTESLESHESRCECVLMTLQGLNMWGQSELNKSFGWQPEFKNSSCSWQPSGYTVTRMTITNTCCVQLHIVSHLPPNNVVLSWSPGRPAHTPPGQSALGCLVPTDGVHHSSPASHPLRWWDVGGLCGGLKWCWLIHSERVMVGG